MADIPAITIDDVAAVSPALAAYTKTAIIEGVWRRPGLSPRDRSLVTAAALIAGERTVGYAHYFITALGHGVTAAELSEICLQVAFCAGWSTAFSAVPVLKRIFDERGVGAGDLPAILPDPLPLEAALPGDEHCIAALRARFGGRVPGLVDLTSELLCAQIWRRPGLNPRDRDLVTLAAMIGCGQTEFLSLHLTKAAASGIHEDEVSEVITHLSFYIGWPAAFSVAAAASGGDGTRTAS